MDDFDFDFSTDPDFDHIDEESVFSTDPSGRLVLLLEHVERAARIMEARASMLDSQESAARARLRVLRLQKELATACGDAMYGYMSPEDACGALDVVRAAIDGRSL